MRAGRDTRYFDVGIVGAGVVGLSAAAELVRREVSVCCFEQGRPGAAQSAGRTRIFRHRHDEADMVRLALRARSAWRSLEQQSGEVLLGTEGVVMIGGPEDDAERLSDLSVAVEVVRGDALRRRMPLGSGATPPEGAVVDLDGGAIRADRAIAVLAHAVAAQLMPAEVFGLTPLAERVGVHTSEGTFSCGHVVVAAGAETRRFAAELGITLPERRALHVRVAFEARHAGVLSCLLDRSGIYGETVYASPADEGRILTIGLSSEDNALPVDEHDRLVPGADPAVLEQRIAAYARAALPDALGPSVSTRLCMATPLAAGDDTIGTWRCGPVTLLAGSNLFKFAPVLGELLADAAQGAAHSARANLETWIPTPMQIAGSS